MLKTELAGKPSKAPPCGKSSVEIGHIRIWVSEEHTWTELPPTNPQACEGPDETALVVDHRFGHTPMRASRHSATLSCGSSSRAGFSQAGLAQVKLGGHPIQTQPRKRGLTHEASGLCGQTLRFPWKPRGVYSILSHAPRPKLAAKQIRLYINRFLQ